MRCIRSCGTDRTLRNANLQADIRARSELKVVIMSVSLNFDVARTRQQYERLLAMIEE